MKRALFALAVTAVGLVMLLNYDVPAPTPLPAVAIGSPTAPSSAAPPTSSGAPPESSAPPAEGQPRTLTGTTVETEQGPVQVEIVMSGTQITEVRVLQYPNDSGRDAEINEFALPQLVDQVLALQSADIQMVSGATYTSEGFIASLQSALDQA